MTEAGIPKEQQKDVAIEDAITAAPAADVAPDPADADATASLEEATAPVANVNFSADNA